MTLKQQIYALSDEIDELKKKQKTIEKQWIEQVQREATKNIGRCFEKDGYLVKIVDVPQVKWGLYNDSFNEYQYEAVYFFPISGLKKREWLEKDIVRSDTFYIGSKSSMRGVTEMTPEKFRAELKKWYGDFLCAIQEDT